MAEKYSGRRKTDRRMTKDRRKNWSDKAWEAPHAFELAHGKRRPGSDRRKAKTDRRAGSMDRRRAVRDRRVRTDDRRQRGQVASRPAVNLPVAPPAAASPAPQIPIQLAPEEIRGFEGAGHARPRANAPESVKSPVRGPLPPAKETRKPIDVYGIEPKINPMPGFRPATEHAPSRLRLELDQWQKSVKKDFAVTAKQLRLNVLASWLRQVWKKTKEVFGAKVR